MKQLFPKETHATDRETVEWIEKNEGQSLPSIRAWCGKSTSPQAIVRGDQRPSCYQCGLIWDKERVLAAAPAGQPADQKMTLGDCMRLLEAEECPACRGAKMPKLVFCRHCFNRLPGELRAALYRRYGQGFEQAYFSSMAILKPRRPAA